MSRDDIIGPQLVKLSVEEINLCKEFSSESAKSQREAQFGGSQKFNRAVDKIARDTLIGKLAEVAFSKFFNERFGVTINLDFNIYPRGSWDDFDVIINGNLIDIKATKSGGKWLLIEASKLEFRKKEGRLPHSFIHSVTEWNRIDDMFAGIGGFRFASEGLGIETVYANDIDQACKKTYDKNFSQPFLDNDDIWNVIKKPLPNFDFLFGGFPCQAFSIAGYRKGFQDEKGRGDLFFALAKLIEMYQPIAFLLENVKNLATHDGGKTFRIIKNTIENDLDYSLHSSVLNSMEYGNVPQNRERVFLVGFKSHAHAQKFSFPEKINLTKTVQNDILIPSTMVADHYYYNGKPLFQRIENEIAQGGVYQWRRKYVRENKKNVIPTLTANMGMGGHNVPIIRDDRGVRKLTPMECARAQGLPSSFVFSSDIPESQMYKQVGNSVTVPVISRIIEKMLKAIQE